VRERTQTDLVCKQKICLPVKSWAHKAKERPQNWRYSEGETYYKSFLSKVLMRLWTRTLERTRTTSPCQGSAKDRDTTRKTVLSDRRYETYEKRKGRHNENCASANFSSQSVIGDGNELGENFRTRPTVRLDKRFASNPETGGAERSP